MTRTILASFILLLFCSPGARAQSPAPPDSLYDIRDSVLIPTRDGRSISATIVTKKGEREPRPAILFFTTYDEGARDSFFGKITADRGYAGIVAYARGIRTNLDDYVPYLRDGDDAYDVIDWASRQPWCDGRVGMFGGSYTGFAQWSTARDVHPALKTIVPQAAVMPGFDTPIENNVPQGFTLGWAVDILKYPRPAADLQWRWYERGSSYRSLDSLAGQPNRIFQEWLRHPSYDAYWSSLAPTPGEYERIGIPILCTTGYFDGAQLGALQYVKQYYRHNPQPNLYLVIGPYDHRGAQRGMPSDTTGGYAIDPVAKVSMRGLALDWFDHILKGREKPAILKDRINYQVMGSNEWRHVSTPADISNDTLTFHLSDARAGGVYLLAAAGPPAGGWVDQSVDFTRRDDQNNYFTPFIINDSLDPSNGLVFATEPFPGPVTVNGGFFGNLAASINKKDMDVSIAFYERTPDGKYFYLTRYLGRASYAKDPSRRQLLAPGEVERIPVRETRMVSRRFSRGSRLVCVLNVNKHPFEEINYGTGKDVHDETIADAGAPLRVRWLNESYLKVPVFWDTVEFAPTTIFIVRHAEKAARPAGDPPLLEAGEKRASDLARLLGRAGIRAIYASQYLRARQTAEPLSKQSGIPITVVPVTMSPMNPRELSRESIDELVGRIRRHPGETALIVGHSNTVPGIIRALGGDPVPAIEDADYDNLYIVTTVGRGTAKVARLSF